MPATRLEIVYGIHRVLTAEGPLTEDDFVAALKAEGLDLGGDPLDTVADLLESDEVGLVMPLGDGRHAWLPALFMGRTFTHRVSPAEIEHGFLDVSPDLEPLSLLTEEEIYLRLLDGTRLIEVLAGFDDELLAERGIPADSFVESAWLLDPAALRELEVGADGLVGVTVRTDGFELTKVTSPTHAADPRRSSTRWHGWATVSPSRSAASCGWRARTSQVCSPPPPSRSPRFSAPPDW